MKKLYEVMAVYGGFDEPYVLLPVKPFVGAADEQEAVFRSGIHEQIVKMKDWNPEFISIIVRELGEYKSSK